MKAIVKFILMFAGTVILSVLIVLGLISVFLLVIGDPVIWW